MTTSNTGEQTAPAAAATATEPKATTKPTVAPRKPRVARSKGKSGKKTTPAKKNATAPKKATKDKPEGARQGSKTEKILELLTRPRGATTKELLKATGWQPHSLRGFLSGTVGKKMGLAVTSTKGEDGDRSYSIKG